MPGICFDYVSHSELTVSPLGLDVMHVYKAGNLSHLVHLDKLRAYSLWCLWSRPGWVSNNFLGCCHAMTLWDGLNRLRMNVCQLTGYQIRPTRSCIFRCVTNAISVSALHTMSAGGRSKSNTRQRRQNALRISLTSSAPGHEHKIRPVQQVSKSFSYTKKCAYLAASIPKRPDGGRR